jgi:predicted DNA-binding transcriptional regulator YafY
MVKESRWDRQLRLHKIEHTLYRCGKGGIAVTRLAQACEVSVRTTQRDLAAIEEMGMFPIWWEDGKCGTVGDSYLPPIRFSPSEALNIFLAARLMLSYAQRYDPDIASIFTKLNCVMPEAIREQVRRTLEWMEKLPRKGRLADTMKSLAEAWINGKVIRIWYRPLSEALASAREVEIYFIQPSSPGHAAYVIGRCRSSRDMRTFKAERIERIEVLAEAYNIPADFDANEYLSSAWGIVTGGKVVTVKLKIENPEMVRIMEESVWHPSQEISLNPDGSAVMTLKISRTPELVSWIMGWGARMEVLSPKELREEIKTAVREMGERYGETG